METGMNKTAIDRPTLEGVLTGCDKNLAFALETRDRLNNVLGKLGEARPSPGVQDEDRAQNPIVQSAGLNNAINSVLVDTNELILELEKQIGF